MPLFAEKLNKNTDLSYFQYQLKRFCFCRAVQVCVHKNGSRLGDPTWTHFYGPAQPSPEGLAEPEGWAGLTQFSAGLGRLSVRRSSLTPATGSQSTQVFPIAPNYMAGLQAVPALLQLESTVRARAGHLTHGPR